MINKRYALRVAAAICGALGAGMSVVPASAAPQQHGVTGWVKQGAYHVISATGVNYGPATGDLWILGRFHAKVTCMVVTGNSVRATAQIDSQSDPTTPIGELVVADGIVGPNAASTLWRVSFNGNGAIYPVSNGCWAPYLSPVAIEDGLVNVS